MLDIFHWKWHLADSIKDISYIILQRLIFPHSLWKLITMVTFMMRTGQSTLYLCKNSFTLWVCLLCIQHRRNWDLFLIFFKSTREAFVLHHWDTGKNKADSLLINGKGRFKTFGGQIKTTTPTAVFNVESGTRLRVALWKINQLKSDHFISHWYSFTTLVSSIVWIEKPATMHQVSVPSCVSWIHTLSNCDLCWWPQPDNDRQWRGTLQSPVGSFIHRASRREVCLCFVYAFF